jgi:hypothetical protein
MFTHRSNQRSHGWLIVSLAACILSWGICSGPIATAQEAGGLAPYRHGGSVAAFFPDITYDPAIPTPESVLGFELGSRPVRYDQVVDYFTRLADVSPRAQLHPFGHTHEGRTLYYLIVGSEANVSNAELIRANIEKLALPPDDGIVSGSERIISESPAIAWLGYSIHGDELSGVDAALWTAYQLIARNDQYIQKIRDNVLTLIDPIQNPDGRERYLAQIFSLAGVVGNTDVRSMQHEGAWPWGRTNHYLFDMNRDWVPLVHPETRGRVRAILHWNPQLMVDAHEMGAFSTFLFSPPREPINHNVTPAIRRWWDVFAADQGKEFDRRRWSYYTGDWNEEWYPGYGSSWCLFTGAVGILYEQAGVAGSGVKREDGTTLSFAQSVAQQSVSSLANLTTVAAHRKELLSDFASFRRDAVTGAAPGLRGAMILVPSENKGREESFLGALLQQGIRIKRASKPFTGTVQSPQGAKSSRSFPAGSFIVPLNQPLGMMAKAILEFDPHLTSAFLEEERRELEKGNGTRLYEITGWSLSLAYDLDISYSPSPVSVASDTWTGIKPEQESGVENDGAEYGFLIPTIDDRSMAALVRMMDRGLQVRACERGFVHSGTAYAAGTLLLRRAENPEDLPQQLHEIASATGARIIGAPSGYSESGPDLGSDLFCLLRAPRIGLFMGEGIDFTSCGTLWYLLDHELQSRLSLLSITQLSSYDLAAYNVLIIPSYWGGAAGLASLVGPGGIQALKDWMANGGTLIAIGPAAYFCADSTSGLSMTREKGAVLGQLDAYDQAYDEAQAAFAATVDTNAVWRGPSLKPKSADKTAATPDVKDLKVLDDKGKLFQPRGVIVRLDLDPEHWLSFGLGAHTNGIIYSSDALVAKDPADVPARLGTATEMRLAGLLWPEARARWEKTAYLTREDSGKGQIILFADDPFFRAYFHGTKRLFLNAVLLGPGMGTSQPAPW